VLGLLAASWIAGRVLSTVRGLNAAAQRLQQGGRFEMPELQLREAEAVGAAMQQAARAMEQVKYLAQHDPLTGLANRLLFVELARHQIAVAQRQQQSLALLALDLDGFKAVNDGDGHAAGDKVLKQAAQRLLAACRAADVVARIGGDEFMVLLGPTEVGQADATAARILQALSQPYQGSAAAVSASIGLALLPRDGDTLEQLMAAADAALYAAKAAGKNRYVEA
jgi:diguanylate cyclase (GGDEF)-like protein